MTGIASALTINEPRQNNDYYVNLIDFDVTWDSGVIKCQYALNNQSNRTFDCQDTFIIDIPYHSGKANITLYGTDGLDVVTDRTVTLNIIGENNSTRGLIGLGVILFAIFVSLFMFLIAIGLTFIETERNEHIALKIGFVLLGMVMLFPAYNAVNILIRMYIHLDALSSVMSPFAYAWIFIIIIFFIFIYIIYKLFMLFDNKKHKTGEYDD